MGPVIQENRPSTPVFDKQEYDADDKNDYDEEGNLIFEQIKAQVKELDSDDDQEWAGYPRRGIMFYWRGTYISRKTHMSFI